MTQRKNQVLGKTARIWLAGLLLLLVCIISTSAQQGGTTQYFYDDNGRLYAVVAPNGETAIYEYDATGNILAIRRLPAGTLTLFSFNPHEGVPGDRVTFLGSGFATGQTTVFFNGMTAQVLESSATHVIAVVPDGATTGPITLTTPGGSITTSIPFTIRGMKVTPSAARLYLGDTLQLTSTVYSQVLSPAVRWSVGSVDGGNSIVGTVTATGFYTSPQRVGTFIVRATLIEDPTIFAESQIEVRDPNNLQSVFSAVSVRRGLPNGGGASAQAVSVRKGATIGSNPVAPAVSVRKGLVNGGNAISRPISVLYGSQSKIDNPQSKGVSVRYGLSNGSTAVSKAVSVRRVALNDGNAYSGAVSVSNAPHIAGISPASVRRGATVSITVAGSNLTNVTGLTFINVETGALITNIVVTNITVSSDGTSLTATLSVPTVAGLAKLVVVARTTDQGSLTTDTGNNTILIVQ